MFARWTGLVVATGFLLACAALDPTVVNHSFAFNANSDSPDIYIVDYRYGDSKNPMASNSEDMRLQGKSLQATSIHGPMKRGEFLYVKWRIKGTDEVYEDTVDLRHRLPADITRDVVYFIVRERQLFVYVVTPERRLSDDPQDGPKIYAYRRTIRIYPDKVQ